MAPDSSRADVPKTDRELLLDVHKDIGYIKERLDGPRGLCERVARLENWRWYIGGALALLCFLVAGRYILGPTAWP